jgi:hypothetical protein
MGSKTLPTIWGTYMTLVTKYQISVINRTNDWSSTSIGLTNNWSSTSTRLTVIIGLRPVQVLLI